MIFLFPRWDILVPWRVPSAAGLVGRLVYLEPIMKIWLESFGTSTYSWSFDLAFLILQLHVGTSFKKFCHDVTLAANSQKLLNWANSKCFSGFSGIQEDQPFSCFLLCKEEGGIFTKKSRISCNKRSLLRWNSSKQKRNENQNGNRETTLWRCISYLKMVKFPLSS